MARRHNKKHTQKLESVLTKQENEGYRASKKKSKVYQKDTVWLRHTISQEGIRPNGGKTEAINNLKAPTNTKTLKLFLEQDNISQNSSKNYPEYEQYETTVQLLTKGTHWEWTKERNGDFNNFKKELTTQLCPAHYNGNKENIVTTDASKADSTKTNQRRFETYRFRQPT